MRLRLAAPAPSVVQRVLRTQYVSPEKGGVLRTNVQRPHQRALLLIAVVALLVVPLTLLGKSSHGASATLTAAPRQELVSAVVPSSTPPVTSRSTSSPTVHHHVATTPAPKVHHPVVAIHAPHVRTSTTPRVRPATAAHLAAVRAANRRAALAQAAAARRAVLRARAIYHQRLLAEHRAAVRQAAARRAAERRAAARAAWARRHLHAPAAVHGRYRTGVATWYSWRPGQCATSYLPKGTRIYVHEVGTSLTISCVVTDRQARNPGRVVDLNEESFSELAPLNKGVVRVIVTW